MSINTTFRLQTDTQRIELRVELKQCEHHEGQLDVDLNPVNEPYNELSISAGSWERRGPRGPWREDSFGQCIDVVESFANGWSNADQKAALLRLCEIWRAWHLNGLNAGTTAQQQIIDAGRKAGTVQDYPYYETACAALSLAGLLTDRGYRYGTKWLTKRLPLSVQTEVLSLLERLAP